MDFNTLFWLSTFISMPFWFLMIWLPDWSWTKRIVSTPLIALPICLLYTINIIPIFDTVIEAFLNASLPNFITAISQPANAVGTWQHLLAFDLVAGFWVYHDGYGRGINRWLMTLSLILILMLGPVGFLVYLLIRSLKS